MCGIAGYFGRVGGWDGDPEAVARRMSGVLAHRGPDDTGHWVDPANGIALAFRRLAIIDLSAQGHQPMVSASGRFTVTFNGEIYNHRALRAELAAIGARFRGHSDTEVMLAGFEQWGVEATITRCLGMFAIAVWDRERRALTLIRDRLGIKPLFVYWKDGLLSFASEIKALHAGPAFDGTIDPVGVAEYFRRLYVPAPRTVFQHVTKLRPGHSLTIVDPAAPPPASVPYWSLADVAARGTGSPHTGDDETILREWDALLTDAVNLHLESDVPLGALLSGGIDSSIVVAIMQQASRTPVRTFTVRFSHPDHDESPHARRVAEALGTFHTEMEVTGADALAAVPSLAEMFDEPMADHSQVPAYLVMKLARTAVTVALTGDGGDELLGGYNRYIIGSRMIPRLSAVPRAIRGAAAGLLSLISPELADQTTRRLQRLFPRLSGLRLGGQKISKLAALLRANSVEERYQVLVSAWTDPESLIAGLRTVESSNGRGMPQWAGATLLDRMMLSDQLTYLPDDQLAKVDRVSMAVSLEARVPLLDHRLLELAWRLPNRVKVRGQDGKWLLRQSLYRRLPRALVDREKVGFTVPLADWLRGPLRSWAEDYLDPGALARDGTLNPAPIRARWSAFLEGRNDDVNALWAVLMFRAWQERWPAGGPR